MQKWKLPVMIVGVLVVAALVFALVWFVKKDNPQNSNGGVFQSAITTDSDLDGLSNDREIELGTDPMKGDTDGDGVSDSAEIRIGKNPLVADFNFDSPDVDADKDGLPDLYELEMSMSGFKDTDQDGLIDNKEYLLGTDLNNPDTDGDGFTDGSEVFNGYNPKGAGKLGE